MLKKTKIAWHIAGIRGAIVQTFKKNRPPTIPEYAHFNARYEALLSKLNQLGMTDEEFEKEMRHMLHKELKMSLEDFVAACQELTLEAMRHGVLI